MNKCTLYEEEIKVLLSLPPENRGHIMEAILKYCIGEEIPELDAMENGVYQLVIGQVKRAGDLSNKRRESVNSRWKSSSKSIEENTKLIQNDTKDVLNNSNLENEDTSQYTNTNTNTNTNTITITNTVTNTNTNILSEPDAENDVAPKKSASKKPKVEKIKYADFVSMTNEEYSSLVARVGEAGALRCIEILDNYKGANGKKYNSDYRAILNWVLDRYNKEQAETVQTAHNQPHSLFNQQQISKNPFVNAAAVKKEG